MGVVARGNASLMEKQPHAGLADRLGDSARTDIVICPEPRFLMQFDPARLTLCSSSDLAYSCGTFLFPATADQSHTGYSPPATKALYPIPTTSGPHPIHGLPAFRGQDVLCRRTAAPSCGSLCDARKDIRCIPNRHLSEYRVRSSRGLIRKVLTNIACSRLYGISLLQFYRYVRLYPTDTAFIRTLVRLQSCMDDTRLKPSPLQVVAVMYACV